MIKNRNYQLKKQAKNNISYSKNYYSGNYISEFKGFITDEVMVNMKNNFLQLSTQNNWGRKMPDTNSVYSRSSFNEFGDVVRHLNKPLPKKFNSRKKIIYKKWDGIISLNDFAKYAKTKNIKVYFLFPNYPESEFALNKDAILKYAADLTSELHIKILNNPVDFVFADSLFFDSIYHLNKKGRKKRTNMLIEIFRRNQIHSTSLNHRENRRCILPYFTFTINNRSSPIPDHYL